MPLVIIICILFAALLGFARKVQCDDLMNDFDYVPLDSLKALHEQILSPSLIEDDETLFLAAAAERDSSMSKTLKLQNNHWLMHKGRPNEVDSAPFRLRNQSNFINTLQLSKRVKKYCKNAQAKAGHLKTKTDDQSQLSDPDNYRLDLTEGGVNLMFRYSFN